MSKEIINLMYHCVYKQTIAETGFQSERAYIYKLSESTFESQVAMIVDYCKANNIELDQINFTFDDGGISFINTIAPILEKYNLTGIFFIATKFIGTKGFLTETDIKELHQRGHIIGSHSHSHVDSMTDLSYDEMEQEWCISISILEKIIDGQISMASIPNGAYSKNIVRAAAACDITTLYTSTPTTHDKLICGINIRGRYAIQNRTSLDECLNLIENKQKRRALYIRYLFLTSCKIILGGNYLKIRKILLK